MFGCEKNILIFLTIILSVNYVRLDDFKDRTHWKEIENKTWIDFKEKYELDFENKTEEQIRRVIFLGNLRRVVRHNLDFKENKVTYEMRIYEFARYRFKELEDSDDNSSENSEGNDEEEESSGDFYDEWNYQFGFKKVKNDSEFIEVKDGSVYIPKIKNYQTPLSFDWRKRGVITDVKNQGECGSCYAVTSIDVLESRLLMKTKRHFDLSIQEIVDCSKTYENDGCSGGWPHHVYQYIKDKGGVVYDKDYPYAQEEGKCDVENLNRMPIKLAGYKYVRAADYQDKEILLKQALFEYGPIVVTIHTSVQLMYYSNGIFYEEDCHNKKENENSLHVVLLVGYDTIDGEDFWIAKNSWGTEWGEKGYIRIHRHKSGDCGFQIYDAYFPVFDDDLENEKANGGDIHTTPDTFSAIHEMKNDINHGMKVVHTLTTLTFIFGCVIFVLVIYLIVTIRKKRRTIVNV